MAKNIRTYIVMLAILIVGVTMSGCVAPEGEWKIDGTVKHSDKESTIPVVTRPIKEETPELILEQVDQDANLGAIIITIAPPGTEIVLKKEYDGVMTIYDSVITDDNGDAELIAPVPGIYTLTTPFSEHKVSVEEFDIIARHVIRVV